MENCSVNNCVNTDKTAIKFDKRHICKSIFFTCVKYLFISKM